MFDKSHHDSTNNENISQSIIMFIIYLLTKNYRHGLGCRCIYYFMVLLRFHTICLYAKLIISSLLIIFVSGVEKMGNNLSPTLKASYSAEHHVASHTADLAMESCMQQALNGCLLN